MGDLINISLQFVRDVCPADNIIRRIQMYLNR